MCVNNNIHADKIILKNQWCVQWFFFFSLIGYVFEGLRYDGAWLPLVHLNGGRISHQHKWDIVQAQEKVYLCRCGTTKPTTATPPPYCWWKNADAKKIKGRHGKAERVNVFRQAEPSAVWWSYQLEGGRRTGLQLANGRRRESKCSESGDVQDRGERSGESPMYRGSALCRVDIRPLGVGRRCIF